MHAKNKIWLKFFLECNHIKNRDWLTAYLYQECFLYPELRNEFFDEIYAQIEAAPLEKKTILTEKYMHCVSELFERFGRYDTKVELDELYLSLHFPDVYSDILLMLDEKLGDTEEKLTTASEKLHQIAQTTDIPIEIKFRRKSLMSIYAKMEYLNTADLNKIDDIIGMRVIILSNQVDDCYTMLEAIHEAFQPNIRRYKDYIAIPKINGYQAIHTNVFWLYDANTNGTEIQIKTKFMEQRDSSGSTAHIIHKTAKDNPTDTILLGTTYREQEMIQKREKHIYILTKDYDIMQIPKRTTVIDLAYMLHTWLGDRIIGADINGVFCEPDRRLREWDHVIIRHHPLKKQSNIQWLKIPYLHKKSRKHLHGKS